MDENKIDILLIEDNPGDARLIKELLEETTAFRFTLVHAGTFSEGRKKFSGHTFNVILLDIGLPDISGLEAIPKIKKCSPDAAIVMLTGLDDEETAISTLQVGVQDYLVKGRLEGSTLVRSLRYAIERKHAEVILRKANEELETRIQERTADLLSANKTINASNCLLKLFTRTSSKNDYLNSVVELVRDWSGCRCVGVRILDENDNIPYESYIGYNREFWESENWLSVKTDHCICIRVITEKHEHQDAPYISPYGSFYCNNSVEFINSLTDEEKKRFRGVCVQSGFLSIAVIPIRHQNKVLGAFHIVDEEAGKISLKNLEFIEAVAPVVGEVIRKFSIEEDRSRLMAAAESAADAIIITDARGKIQYANPVLEHITGYSKEEAVGQDLHFLDSGRHDEAFYQVIRETMKQGRVWNGLLISKKKDGTLYHEDCTISPMKDSEGKISNFVSVRRDTTDKLRLESIAEAVNTMNNIGYVFSGIRHEIGNPINSIKMTLNVIQANLDNYSKPAVREYIGRLLEEVAKIEYLLKSLKTFNIYEEPELQKIRLSDFMDKFFAISRNNYGEKGIAITASLEPDVSFCHADPRALQQVLLNILTNAIDACEKVSNPKISVAALKFTGAVCLRVVDNGCGMTEEQQKNMFKPFFTTKPDGTGLGLVIAKKMLAKMNSTIEVKSRINEGTEVDIYIPGG